MDPFRFAAIGLLAVALLLPLSFAQSVNDPAGSLTFNGLDGGVPNTLVIGAPNSLDMSVSGNPNVPFVLLAAPSLSVGEGVFGPGLSLDIGGIDQVSVVMDGLNPSASILNQFANTGAGNVDFTFPLPAGLPPGSLGSFQAILVDFSLPSFLAFTAATEVVIASPCDYGTVTFGRGAGVSGQAAYVVDGATSIETAAPAPSGSFSIGSIYFARYASLFSQSGTTGDLDRFRAPTADRPVRQAANFSFQHIKTIHGDLYTYFDGSTSEYGYFLSTSAGLTEIPGTRVTTTGFLPGWLAQIAISDDSSTMVAVHDNGSGQRLRLIKLDGTTFTANGQSVIDITPPGISGLATESLRFSGGRVYAAEEDFPSGIFVADADPTGPAAPLGIPPLGTGGTVIDVSHEVFQHVGTGDIYFRAGDAAGEDIYRIDGTSGAVNNVSNFATGTSIDNFGTSYQGNGHISVSPSGTRVAFVADVSFDEEVFIGFADGSLPPVQVTNSTRFDDQIDDVGDLNMWSDQDCLFFVGTTFAAADLYNFNLMTASVDNITQTNSQTGAILPISSTPAATIDGDGYFTSNGYMFFVRDGVVSQGPSAGTLVKNLVGVDYATLTPFNVTGDEFFGVPGPNTESIIRPCFAPDSDRMWFEAKVEATGSNELFTFDPAAGTVASQRTNFGVNFTDIDNITPNANGSQALFSFRIGGASNDEEIGRAFVTSSFTQMTDDGLGFSDIADGSIRFLDPSAPCNGFLFARGSGDAANPGNATLRVQAGNGIESVVSSTPGTYWIYSVGP